MRHYPLVRAAVGLCLAPLLAHARADPPAPRYSVTDLGPIEDVRDLGYTPDWSLNEKGEVAWRTREDSEAHLWSANRWVALGDLTRVALRDDGEVVGLRSADPAHGGYHQTTYRTVLWNSGKITDLGPTGILAGDALGINSRGAVVGSADSPAPHPPTVLHPRGTGVITGRVVYEGGQPAASVVVVAAMQSQASLSLEMPYMIQHGGRIRDKKGDVIGLSYEGPIPEDIERVQSARAVTAADGTYRLVGLTTAPYNLWAAPKGTSPSAEIQRPWDWVATAAEGVAAREGESAVAPDLTLTHGVVIQGRVLDQATGRPLKGIIVTCHGPQRPASSGQTLNTATDGAGRFTLRVTPGHDDLGIGGVMVDVRGTDEMHDWSAKLDGALWTLDNHFTASVDGGPPRAMKSPVETAAVGVRGGEAHSVVFRLRRAALQYRLRATGGRTP